MTEISSDWQLVPLFVYEGYTIQFLVYLNQKCTLNQFLLS